MRETSVWSQMIFAAEHRARVKTTVFSKKNSATTDCITLINLIKSEFQKGKWLQICPESLISSHLWSTVGWIYDYLHGNCFFRNKTQSFEIFTTASRLKLEKKKTEADIQYCQKNLDVYRCLPLKVNSLFKINFEHLEVFLALVLTPCYSNVIWQRKKMRNYFPVSQNVFQSFYPFLSFSMCSSMETLFLF